MKSTAPTDSTAKPGAAHRIQPQPENDSSARAKHSSLGARRGGRRRCSSSWTCSYHEVPRLRSAIRLVFVLASRSRKRAFLLGIAGACIVLTWVGYFLEPSGAPWWMSVFDRSMITMVLLLTLALAWNRQPLIASLAERTEALEHAKDTIQSANQELVVVNRGVATPKC